MMEDSTHPTNGAPTAVSTAPKENDIFPSSDASSDGVDRNKSSDLWKRRGRRAQSLGELALMKMTSLGLERGRRIVEALYEVNYSSKSIWAKMVIVIYMSFITFKAIENCDFDVLLFLFYLTHWGWIIELFYFAYSLYLDLCARAAGGDQYISIVARTFCQVMGELAFVLQFGLTALFWLVVYPQETWRELSWEVHMHVLGLTLICLDHLFRFASFSMQNHKYILGFSVFYMLLHFIAVLYQGEIYPGMSFRDFQSYVISFFGFAATVTFHKAFYLVSNWRDVKKHVRSFFDVIHFITIGQQSPCSLSLRLGRQASLLGQEIATPSRRLKRRLSDTTGHEIDSVSFFNNLVDKSTTSNLKED